jgi:hypothetical protein
MVTAPVAPVYSRAKRITYAKKLARANQDKGGTCTGFSTKFYAELLYMFLTGDLPTDDDKAQVKTDVIDAIGTRYDTGYPRISVSAEAFYQLGRFIGNVTYPSGGEIRFTLRAWLKYGWMLESQWHTDKERTCVWMYPPGVRSQANGGITQEQAEAFGQLHKIDGYAMCGTPDGGAEWGEICASLDAKGAVLGAIPIYENFRSMEGGDGTFPDPAGELAGFHALCFYDYDDDWLYLIHSWGNWCGQFGKISRQYFNVAKNLSVWMVALDQTEVAVAKEIYKSLTIMANVPAQVTVDGVIIGLAPQKIAIEPGKKYQITVSADGYIAQTRMVDDSSAANQVFALEPSPQPVRSWFQILIEWLINLFKRK